MATLIDSVGAGGRNLPADVRLVQRLLNRKGARPPLREDGVAGPLTTGAIRAFQKGMGQTRADGRVDPGRRTLQALRAQDPPPPRGAARRPAGHPAPPPSPAGGRRPVPSAPADRGPDGTGAPAAGAGTRSGAYKRPPSFVGAGVRETPMTTRIIDAIAPSFEGVRAKVISGYMNDEELFWKVNYHWDYLLWMLEHALELPMERRESEQLRSLVASLRACAPRPDSGYRTSPVGKPKDASSMEEMTERHRRVSQAKRAFKEVIQRASLKSKSSRTGTAFDYAVAPVAHPGTSKHATGYAIDVAGDNARIRDLTNQLGATLVFDEKSHVHVEFKNGVAGRG